ncbi:hypothetical protein HRI_000082000 [Hibiscus trionum]|uniref:AP2/ERF domain-containing protein n=1 Tax=Hibiscus trionum TaxID=183268 RepID=A0A9W7GU44_HIBTR|nr:hypothetical protein HRI_000081400 [Hibiscus trionum]GMI64127.1 hypothetical protein HRI_000082000 [Hibiscus trionum]
MSAGESSGADEKKYKGVRRRRWGKWVSEIRVPGTEERLWLGSYSTPEAAAVAHHIAFYCLRRPSSLTALNFLRYYLRVSIQTCRPSPYRKRRRMLGWQWTPR